MSGAFLTSREIFENPIWKNIIDFRLFFLIYGQAVFLEEGHKVSEDLTLKRGEWLRSTRKLQEDLEYIENRQVKTYSTSVINRAILRLVKVQKIRTRIHELGTVFEVVNYEMYQRLDNYKKSELGTELGTVGEQSGNNNKYVKNELNKDLKHMSYSDEFEQFWTIYPRKEGKKRAYGCWKQRIKEIDPNQLILATKNYAESCKEKESQFIKLPSTFLSAKQDYEDYLKSNVVDIDDYEARRQQRLEETRKKLEEYDKRAEEARNDPFDPKPLFEQLRRKLRGAGSS